MQSNIGFWNISKIFWFMKNLKKFVSSEKFKEIFALLKIFKFLFNKIQRNFCFFENSEIVYFLKISRKLLVCRKFSLFEIPECFGLLENFDEPFLKISKRF